MASNVLIFVESRYKINRKRVKGTVMRVMKEAQVETPFEVSIAIVGDRKARELARKYMGDDKVHNVLSFSQTDLTSFQVQSDILRLGDIVISYPEVIREAAKEEKFVDDKVDELVEHGLLHLLGLHHDE